MNKSSQYIITTLHFCNLVVLVFLCYYIKWAAANNTIMCVEEEREALLKFKQGITDDGSELLLSWGDNLNCCEWHGIRCDNHTSRVTVLNLQGFDLKGRVSSSLVDLKHLTYLDLSSNYFLEEPIPKFIGSFVNLKHLNLSYSDFYGQIPHQLGNLSTLLSLDLSDTMVDGSLYVNDLSWLSRLPRLTTLHLSYVNLSRVATNWLQIVNNLPFLKVLRLDRCDLPHPTFARPLSFKNSSTTLSFLSLRGNKLNDNSSVIFEWLFNLSGINTHLAHLDLSFNQLRGSLSSAFGNLHSLSYLDLSVNELQGNIPTSFGNMQSLSYLSLGDNHLEGPIPDTIISNKKPLTYLDLSFNNFQSFPKTLDNLCSLKILWLNNNNLTDELPNIIQSLTGCANKALVKLYLSDNQIWGSTPDSIGDFSSLTILRLGWNKLNGTISESLGQLSMLERLELSSNFLEGTLSNIYFSNLSRLRYLDLGGNTALTLNISADWVPPFQLHEIYLSNCRMGPLFPKWIMTQTNCSSLDLSFNNIKGPIPTFPSGMISILLNDNKFSNPVPFLCPTTKSALAIIGLSNNLLYGKIPDCWMNFPQLQILHIGNNRLYGVIPSSFSHMKYLHVLKLQNNSINGGMQRLESLTSLIDLDLGHNLLNGHIPPLSRKHFRGLRLLKLRNNKFDGVIPLSLCKMSFLQILDLSSNNITGSIPKCISNFSAMQNGTDLLPTLSYTFSPEASEFYINTATLMWKRMERTFRDSLGLVKQIDLSNNNLDGEIPTEISLLKGLKSLDLSRNNLIGGITPKLGELTALEFLDLSSNHLSGEIPTSFIDLNFLSMFNVSNNNLSGKIPTSTQLQGFDASAYMGNYGLCGLPLPKCSWDHSLNNSPAIDNNNVSHHDAKESDDDFFLGLCISLVLGFIVGFWGVCGTLVIKRSWRLAFFRSFDDMRVKFCGGGSMIKATVRRRK